MRIMREARRRRGLSALTGISLVGATVVSSFGALAADMAERTCQCVAARDSGALVREARGNVLATQKIGLMPVQSNQTMYVPGRVVAGASSSSVVALGERCEVTIGSNQSAEIRAQGGQLCLQVVDNGLPVKAVAAPAAAVAPAISPLVPLAALGAAGIVTAVVISQNGDDDNVIPLPVSR